MAFGFGGFGGGRPMPGGAGGLGRQLSGVGQSMARIPQAGAMGGIPGGYGQIGGRAQMAGLPFGGGRRGGFSPMPGAGMAQRPGGMPPGASPTMMAGMAALSDEESKTKIRELENELSRTYAALSAPSATANVQPRAPDTDALDAAYRKPGSYSYDYKDPSTPGAAPGRHAGPMADELKGIPGVVERGPDGLDRVNGPRLELANTSEIANLRRDMDALLGNIRRETGQGAEDY